MLYLITYTKIEIIEWLSGLDARGRTGLTAHV